MTDKQIIIDGVDVSGCNCFIEKMNFPNNLEGGYYNQNNLCECGVQGVESYPFFCRNNPNCHYKQLKRKEQKCELLKEDEKYLLNVIDHLQKQKNEWEEKYNDLGQDFDQLKAKNIKIYKTLTKTKEVADKDFRHTAWEEYAKQLKQILQKISECEAKVEYNTKDRRHINENNQEYIAEGNRMAKINREKRKTN